MKQRTGMLALIAAILLSAASQAADKSPVLFLANQSLPPLSFVKDGKPTGLAVDLASALAKRMRRPVEIRLMNWAEAQELVLEARADALLHINPSPERLEVFDFSGPMLASEFSIFTSSDRSGINSFFDLRGLRVGVERQGLPDLFLRQDSRIKVQVVPDFLQGFRMLVTGELDAVVADRRVGSYILAENHIQGVKLTEEPISRSDSAIAVKKGNAALLEEINSSLADIRRDGTYERIIGSWQTKEVVFKTVEQLRQEHYLIAAISAALIVALIGVAVLVIEIRRRKRGEARFRSLYELSLDGIFAVDRNGRFLMANRVAERMSGYSEKELQELAFTDLCAPDCLEKTLLSFQEGLKGQSAEIESVVIDKNGRRLDLLLAGSPLLHSGRVEGIFCICRDITENKRAEQALKESEERFRLALRNAPVSVAVQDLELKYIWAYNQQTAQPDQIIGHFDHEIFAAEEAARVTARKRRVIDEGIELREQMWFNRASGRIFLDVTWAPIRDAAGRVAGVASATVDLTPIKLAEEALRESEAKYRRLFENIQEMVTVYEVERNDQGRITERRLREANPAFLRASGVSSIDEIRGKTSSEIFGKSWSEDHLTAERHAMDNGEVQVQEIYRPESDRYYITTIVPLDSSTYIGTGWDITERKRAEEALRTTVQRFNHILSNIFSGILVISEDNHIELANPTFCDQFNLDEAPSDLVGITAAEMLHKVAPAYADSSENLARIKEILSLKQRTLDEEVLMRDGRVLLRDHIPIQIDGEPGGRMWQHRDITERKRMEEKLRRSESRYRMLHESLRDPFVQVSMDGRIIEFNDLYCRMLGYSPEEMLELTYQQATPERWHAFEEKIVHEQIIARGYSDVYEKEYRRKDGTIISVELRTVLSRDESGQANSMWGIVRDITDRKLMEEELRQSHAELELKVQERTAELRISNKALMDYAAKLEKLNRELEEFAFVASHDLQEPLRKIQTFVSMLMKDHKGNLDEQAQAHLSRIIGSAKRMSDSLHALLNYSHITSEPCRFELVDLKAVVQNIASDLEDAINRAGGKIEIGNLPEVEADSTTIRYLLQNMIDNSIKYCKKVQAPHVKIHGEVSGGTCSIFVEDNGIGFDEQYLDLIFRPFQQLHRRGKYEGIGMGLALCRKIVERHEGSITARSILGQGSTFIVRLPSIQREKNRG